MGALASTLSKLFSIIVDLYLKIKKYLTTLSATATVAGHHQQEHQFIWTGGYIIMLWPATVASKPIITSL